MDNLNNIPKSGSYGAGVDLHNDNYQKIGVELQTLRELRQNNKGYFETLSALQTKYPTPQSGWQAYVKDAGSSTGYYLANVNSSGNWVVTAAEAPPINVDLDGYAKTGGSTKTVKEVEDEIVQLADTVDAVLDEIIVASVLSESFSFSNVVYENGNIKSADIVWPDGDIGTMDNIVVGASGITSIRYNRSNGDYATMTITYKPNGEFNSQNITITKQ